MITINPPGDTWEIGPITVEPPGPIEIGPPAGSERQAREQAVAIVNRYEPHFAANRDDYRAGRISLAQAQSRFDSLWNAMVAELRKLGSEGERAIRDRQPGGQWDWWAYYRPSGGAAQPPPTNGALPPVQSVQSWWVYILVGGVIVWVLLKVL